MTHPYDSTCSCATCRHTSLALQERPDRASTPGVDDPIGKIIAACSGPWLPPVPLAEMLEAQARNEVKLFPGPAAASLARWQQLGIETLGETPASRAASDEDLCRTVQQRLSVLVDCTAIIADLRAKLAVARDFARQHRRDLEFVLADLRGYYGALAGAQLGQVDWPLELTEMRITDALREPTVDDALAGLQVDAALTRAGEAVPVTPQRVGKAWCGHCGGAVGGEQ